MAAMQEWLPLAERGDGAAAIAAYRRALAIDDTSANAHRNLGLALDDAGDRAGAIAELRRSAELAPTAEMKGALASLLVKDAIQMARDKKHAEAVVRYREAISFDPTEWRTHYNLGLALLELGESAQAVSALEQAQELEDSEEVRKLLSQAIEARRDSRADAGDLGGALDDLSRATLLRLQAAPDAGR